MGERHTLKLTLRDREKAHMGVDAAIAKGAAQGKPWTLELRERTRSDEQNDALHGLIAQILRQRTHIAGVKLDKVKLKAMLMQAAGHEIVMLPTINGDGFFPMGLSTSKLTVSEFSNLIEWTLAWCAEQGIEVEHFSSPESTAGEGESLKPAVRAA
jgi:hypothetical protein